MKDTISSRRNAPRDDVDVKRVARLLLDWYGAGAATRARWRAEDRRKSKDAAEYGVWLQVHLEVRRQQDLKATADKTFSAAA